MSTYQLAIVQWCVDSPVSSYTHCYGQAKTVSLSHTHIHIGLPFLFLSTSRSAHTQAFFFFVPRFGPTALDLEYHMGGGGKGGVFIRRNGTVKWNDGRWNGMVVGSAHAFNSLVVSSHIPGYQWRYLYVFILRVRPNSMWGNGCKPYSHRHHP